MRFLRSWSKLFQSDPGPAIFMEARMRRLIALVLLTLVGVGMVAASASACPYETHYEGS